MGVAFFVMLCCNYCMYELPMSALRAVCGIPAGGQYIQFAVFIRHGDRRGNTFIPGIAINYVGYFFSAFSIDHVVGEPSDW